MKVRGKIFCDCIECDYNDGVYCNSEYINIDEDGICTTMKCEEQMEGKKDDKP